MLEYTPDGEIRSLAVAILHLLSANSELKATIATLESMWARSTSQVSDLRSELNKLRQGCLKSLPASAPHEAG